MLGPSPRLVAVEEEYLNQDVLKGWTNPNGLLKNLGAAA
jgi:hypothetical protein